MVYIDIRLTLEEAEKACDKPWKVGDEILKEPEPHQNGIVHALHNYLTAKNGKHHRELIIETIPMKWIWVKEKFNKYGELTKTHYHLNWWMADGGYQFNQDSFRKYINTMGFKGVKVYCMRTHKDIGDSDRWWRYTCKQSVPLTYSGFTKAEIDEFHLLANDEWEQRKIENIAKRQKLEDKNNFRNKLIKHLKKIYTECEPESDKQIFCDIAKFYRKSHQTAPFKKLDDLVIDMKCEIGLLTVEEYYDITH